MKVEQPSEYTRLMAGYESEDELVRDVCGLSVKAYEYYIGGLHHITGKDNKNRK